MESKLRKPWTLVLNALYQPVGVVTIAKGLVTMCSSIDGETMAAQALDLDYELDADGAINWLKPSKFILTDWDDWIKLPVREFDIPIMTPRGAVRAPVVLYARNYKKIHMRKLKCTKKNLHRFYGGKSIWTGKQLSLNESSLEHMTPKSHGGLSCWTNLGISEKKINNERGNIPLSQWKYKPQYKLSEPRPMPASVIISSSSFPREEWRYFLYG